MTTPTSERNRGKFLPGQSGNPSGRPKAANTLIRDALSEGASDVVEIVLKAARAGDMAACKLILDRLLPPMKSNAQPVFLAIPEGATPLEIARAVLTATAAGQCPPDTAASLVSAIGAFCRIEEFEELRVRIAALERATRPPANTNQKPKR